VAVAAGPMSVWLTPGLKPFVGGTYFPPEERYGQPAFKTVLERIATLGRKITTKLVEQAARSLRRCVNLNRRQLPKERSIATILDAAYRQLTVVYDPKEGGFEMPLSFRDRDAQLPDAILRARSKVNPANTRSRWLCSRCAKWPQAECTIISAVGSIVTRSIATGHVPHSKRCFYDQAQLAVAYLDAFQITRDRQYESVARDILDYVGRDMTSKEGGFFSAEDADSPVAAGADRGHPETKEGAFSILDEKRNR